MTLDLLPRFIRENYEIHEWKHATTILHGDFPEEWDDIISTLENFRLLKSWITVGGGGCPILVFGIKKSLYIEDI